MFSSGAGGDQAVQKLVQSPPEALCGRLDEIVEMLRPTHASERRRAEVREFLRSVLRSSLGARATTFAAGSCGVQAYLPGANLDLVASVPASEAGGHHHWFIPLTEALCLSSLSAS